MFLEKYHPCTIDSPSFCTIFKGKNKNSDSSLLFFWINVVYVSRIDSPWYFLGERFSSLISFLSNLIIYYIFLNFTLRRCERFVETYRICYTNIR